MAEIDPEFSTSNGWTAHFVLGLDGPRLSFEYPWTNSANSVQVEMEVPADNRTRLYIRKARWPGTDVRFDLQLDAVRSGADWVLELRCSFPKYLYTTSASIPLEAWAKGRALARILLPQNFEIILGNPNGLRLKVMDRTEFLFGVLRRETEARFQSLEGKLGIEGGVGPFSILKGKIIFELVDEQGDPHGVRHNWATTFSSLPGGLGTEPAIHVQNSQTRSYKVSLEAEAIAATGFEDGASDLLGSLLRGEGMGTIESGSLRLRTDRMAISDRRLIDQPKTILVTGIPSDETSCLVVGGAIVSMGGASDPAQLFRLELGSAPNPELEFETCLRSIELPVRGADVATLGFGPAGRPVRVRIGQQPLPQPAGPATGSDSDPDAFPPVGARLSILPAGPSLAVDLHHSRLDLRRHLDLLALGVELFGSELRLGPRAEFAAVPLPNGVRPKLIVHFTAQHISEQAYEVTLGQPLPTFDPIVEGHAADGSRIAFALPAPITGVPDIATLLNWASLSPLTSKRAAIGRETPTVLAELGIGTTTTRAEMLTKLQADLLPPTAWETAIEIPYRVVLSPDAAATWTPSTAPSATRSAQALQPLWHVRMGADGHDMRVIWSRGDGKILSSPDQAPWPGKDEAGRERFPISVNWADRRQLMLVSSTWGLPAKKRIGADGAPKGSVVSLPGRWAFLHEEEGVYVPQPFRASLLLTALGGSLVAEGRWEPPADHGDYTGANDWGDPLTLERWSHRAHLGRDTSVEVVQKGFLFPLGHRASYVKCTERRFYENPHSREPVAYLVQRHFLEINQGEKSFPALGQPFEGRLLPDVRGLTMLTRRSADVQDARAGTFANVSNFGRENNGALDLPGTTDPQKRPLAFWPRTGTKLGSEFLFELTANEGATIRTPLMFLDNAVVHERRLMRQVVEHYLASGGWAAFAQDLERLRTASLDGGVHRYAPEAVARADGATAGGTKFQTHSWLWSVTGRLGGTGAAPIARMASILPAGAICEEFAMDGLMDGADQPPFYPALERADVDVQPIDRLTGGKREPITVAPNLTFVEKGADAAVNPSEIFLDILEPELPLDFTGAGGTSGGFAHPNAKIVHLSRTVGPIGGSRITRSAIRAGRTALAADEGGDAVSAGFLDAPLAGPSSKSPGQAGTFDPLDFFGDAKLLGVVPLKHVVKAAAISAAPRLIEDVQIAAVGVADAAAATRQALTEAKRSLDRILLQIRGRLEEAALQIGLPWPSVYPQVDRAMQRYERAIAAALAIGPTRPVTELLAAATAAADNLRSLLATLRDFAAQPLPVALVETVAEISRQAETLQKLVTARPEQFRGEVERLFLRALETRFPAEMFESNKEMAAILFGSEAPSLAALQSGDFVAKASQALFYDAVGEPLMAQFGAIRSALNDIEFDPDKAAALIAALIEKALVFGNALGSFAGVARAAQQQCAAVGALLARFSKDAFAPAHDLAAGAAAIREQFMLIVPASESPEFNREIELLRSDAMRALDALGECLAEVDLLIGKMDSAWQAQCDPSALSIVTDLFRLRADAAAQSRDLAAAFGAIVQRLNTWQLLSVGPNGVLGSGLTAAKRALTVTLVPLHEILAQVTSLKAAAAGLTPLLSAELARLGPLWASVKHDARTTQKDLFDRALAQGAAEATRLNAGLGASARDLAIIIERSQPYQNGLAPLADEIASYAVRQDRRLAGLAAAGGRAATAQFEALEQWAYGALGATLANVRPLYRSVDDALKMALLAIDTEPGGAIVRLLLRPEAVARLRGTAQALAGERARIEAIASLVAAGNADAFTKAGDMVAQLKSAPASLSAASVQILDLAKLLAGGQLGLTLPISEIERGIRAELARFVPATATLRYNWQTDLGAFPSGNPIFEMVPTNQRHLTLETKVDINLLTGRRSVKGVGNLKPFRIRLLGNEPELVIIEFNEAKFDIGLSGVRMDVSVRSVTIGNALQFVQLLQQYMGGGGATGPYWQFNPPVLEVGYRFAKDVIQLGSLFLLNVSFQISAELPLTGRDARFRFQIGSPERPLLISNPPYGGGGYVALVANARGIVGFEASFEFGAMTPIRFGPLRGHGRISAGIYISQMAGGATIAGFVRAIGEGNIACFSISIYIEVRLTHEMSTGQMTGEATYKVSFKVAFAKISFSFTARYKVKGSSRAGGAAIAPARDSFLSLWSVDAGTVPSAVVAQSPLKTAKWRQYQRRFDLDVLKEAESA